MRRRAAVQLGHLLSQNMSTFLIQLLTISRAAAARQNGIGFHPQTPTCTNPIQNLITAMQEGID